ncbi:MAG: hypothetical protein COT15_03490 [Candidatus Diapherotrites archaeon CG08_land_8_20_14_0_20_34_12]|nr:MAG: hypothetical protein COT15_03490 [Candidatus Diapherotrites archaeon CG08_land_8_20_14_0_20_34_12]
MKLKKIILLVIIIAAVYFFYWNTDFGAANQKLKTLDGKYLNGVMPIEEKLNEYKTELGKLKNEYTFKGPSAEKNAINALIDMRLKTIELIDAQKDVDSKYKLLNAADADCKSIYFTDLIAAYDSWGAELDSITKMVSKFEKDFAQYKNDSYLNNLKDSMVGMKQGIGNQKQVLNENC